MTRLLSTVEGAVGVLEAFDADHTEWSLSALAVHLNQPTSTLHEHLQTLSACGLLTRLGRGRYRLGWRLLKLSSALYGSLSWYAPAHDAMTTLARSTHLLAFLAVLQPGAPPQVLCVARSVQGREGGAVAGETQFVLPPSTSASGKLLYALHDLTPEVQTHFEEATGLQISGAATLSRPQLSWAQEAATIRRTGYALTRDDWEVGTSGLAVPVHGADGEVLAALGLSFPTPRLRDPEVLLRRLQDVAAEVSWGLGWRGRESTGSAD